MKVLIIEDEKKIASFVRKGLEAHGFVVEVSQNGDEGFALAVSRPYDVAVLDIMLPGKDGLSILRNLRERKIALPVILLTLVRIGILDYQRLSGSRSYFIVANMVACAVITPSGDPFTMLLLAVPVQVLYEISVFIAWTWWKREQKELAALESGSTS